MSARDHPIAPGYEDGNDADRLRRDPIFKLAIGRLPDDADLCSQPTISRLENQPDTLTLLRVGRAIVEHYCQSFRQIPRCIVLTRVANASRFVPERRS